MKIGIIGSGDVGQALAKGFLAEGHDVAIGTREPDGNKGAMLRDSLDGITVTDFAGAAEAELLVFSVNESGIEEVAAAIAANAAGKIVIDTSNSLQPHGDWLVYAGGDESLAEHVQSLIPEALVVKAFNTVGAATMYKPDFGGQMPTMFIVGNDLDAKHKVEPIIESFGWEILDAGDLFMARSLEAMAPIWVNNSMKTQSPHHAFKML